MAATVMNWISTSFAYAISWFTDIVNATGTMSLILAGFAMLFAVTFLISPLRGSRSSGGRSDRAKKKDDGGES